MADPPTPQIAPYNASNSREDHLNKEQKQSLLCTTSSVSARQLQRNSKSPRIHSSNGYLRFLVIAPLIQYPHYTKYIAKGKAEKVYVHKAKVVNSITSMQSPWLRRLRVLLNLKHHNVASYLAVEKRGTYIYVAECCPASSTVRTLIESARSLKRYVKESVVWEILYYILSGLAYLHVHAQHTIPWAGPIIHGAITPENILLLDDEIAVLSSCALWSLFPIYRFDISNASTYLMAPEVIVDPENISLASDIWSVGAVLYEVLTLHPLVRDCHVTDKDGLLQHIYEKVTAIPATFTEYSEEITSLVRCMLRMDPRQRPSVEELLTNKHITYTKYRVARIQESATYLLNLSTTQMSTSTEESLSKEEQDFTIIYNNTLLTTKSKGISLVFLNARGETQLMQAARGKKYAQLTTLIKEEAGAQSADGMTALMYAALFNNSLAVDYLVDKEARLVDNDGNSALIFAIHSNFHHCAEILAPYEGGIVNNMGETALMYATRRHYSDIMQRLASKEAGVQNNSGDTALIIAIRANYSEGVRILAPLEKHIGLMDGTMPKMLAVKLGFNNLVELITTPTY